MQELAEATLNRAKQVWNKEAQVETAIHKSYAQAARRVAQQLQDDALTYGEDGRYTYHQAQQSLTPAERRAYEQDMMDYLYSYPEHEEQIRAWMGQHPLTRMDAILNRAAAEMLTLSVETEERIIEQLTQTTTDTYYKNQYELAMFLLLAFPVKELTSTDKENILLTPNKGVTYIEVFEEMERNGLYAFKRKLTDGLVQQSNIKQLKDLVNKHFKQEGNKRVGLLRDEQAKVMSEASFKAYSDAGVTHYQILATLDMRTTPICQQQDKRIYHINERIPGKTAPLFHYGCRTTTVAYFEDLAETRRARSPITNQNYLIDGNLSYQEWYKRFVRNTSIE